MYHSIYFAETPNSSSQLNTWDDWHLIPSSRPLVNPPQVKTSYLDIPGADGSLDLTEVLTGRPRYGNRTGSWEFYVDNGYGEWHEKYSSIMHYLHGQPFCAWLEDDPDFYYKGRFSVNSWASNPSYSTIVINYVVDPYKLFRLGYGDDWLWDPFSFETGIITDYKNMVVRANGSLTVDVLVAQSTAVAEFIVNSSNLRVTDENNVVYYLNKGSNIISELPIHEGVNRFVFTNSGSTRATFSIKVAGGIL